MSLPDCLNSLDPELRAKVEHLNLILSEMRSLVVAFSGGVDSALLCALGYFVLGKKLMAITVRSPVDSPGDDDIAVELARHVGFTHQLIDFDDLANPQFVSNPPDRCYHCKLARFRQIKEIARDIRADWIAEGSNSDDSNDYRPGMRAIKELGIRSPMAEAAMTKVDIRSVAKALDLPVWNRPSAPCLATRFPYGSPVTREGLLQVAKGEKILTAQGFEPVRVRHFGDTARLEVSPSNISKLFTFREQILLEFRKIGFTYVVIDLAGYRQGSMNEGIKS